MIWQNRYSDTDECDDRGRWARIAYSGTPTFKEGRSCLFELAWIKKNKDKFVITTFYPYKGNYVFSTYEDAKREIEDSFLFFMNNSI